MPNLWKLLEQKIDAITGANHPLSEDVSAALDHLASLMTQAEERIARLESAMQPPVMLTIPPAGSPAPAPTTPPEPQAMIEATKVETQPTADTPAAEAEPEAKP